MRTTQGERTTRILSKFIFIAVLSLVPTISSLLVSATIIPLSFKPSHSPVEISSSGAAFAQTTPASAAVQTSAQCQQPGTREPTATSLSPQDSAFIASFRTRFIQDVAGDRVRGISHEALDEAEGEQDRNPNAISWSSKQGKELLGGWHKAWVRSRLKMRVEDHLKAWFDTEPEDAEDEDSGLDERDRPASEVAVNSTCQGAPKDRDEERQEGSRRSDDELGTSELDTSARAVAGSDSSGSVRSQDVFYLRSLEDPIYISSLDFLELVASSKARRA